MVLIPGILLLIPDPLAFRSRALALISAPTYFVTTLKWRFLKEKLKASLYYPASVISALWVEGKDRWRGEGDKARGYSSPRGGEGGGAARSNPDRISDQKMSFSTAILEASKIYSRIQTWHIDIDDIYMYQENWSETDENMCPNFYEQTFFFLNEKHENFCVTHCLQLKMLHYYKPVPGSRIVWIMHKWKTRENIQLWRWKTRLLFVFAPNQFRRHDVRVIWASPRFGHPHFQNR